MKKELKVLEFNKKKKLIEFVNANSENLEIVSISTCQESIEYSHFLWHYEK